MQCLKHVQSARGHWLNQPMVDNFFCSNESVCFTLLDIALSSSSTTSVGNSSTTNVGNSSTTFFSIGCELIRELKDEGNVKKLTLVEENMKRVLTFLLGFFVTQSIRRWWNQTSKIPHLTDLAVVCNAIFQPGNTTITLLNKHYIIRVILSQDNMAKNCLLYSV